MKRFSSILIAISLIADAVPARGDAGAPSFDWRLDLSFFATGCAGLLVARGLATDDRPVPVTGFETSDIHFGFDRGSIGDDSPDAAASSNVVRNVSLTYPFVLRIVSARGTERLRAPLDAVVVYAEAMTIAESVTSVLKRAKSRPRPFTYLAESDRPADVLYDVSSERAFQSFPSGHAASAWTAVSVGVCDHLLSRPMASWKEHALVGFIGGVLGTATSTLRVEAGQHFPTDVVAGTAIGMVVGTSVPIFHRYVIDGVRAPFPPRRSWIAALAGAATGIGTAVLVGELVSD